MQVAQIFQTKDDEGSHILRPWEEADFEGWLSLLSWKVSTVLRTIITFVVASSLIFLDTSYLFDCQIHE